ncbi:cytosolic iron-sulfur assembly component 2B isoform X2 [Fukomys damarensis]|uniref:cytosolic iron-sulfur assembly component 2B isoform X2 n=1 Tax=Fukomys damarensis TaxID=885580 RepID=UPI00053F9D77|nr:cytosolic iron-sulfur assembly component 2B isoform X2 [Fukomys damarensis]
MEFRFGRIEGLEQRQGDSALHPDQPSPRLLDWNSGIKTQFLLGSALQEGWGLERKCMQIEVHSCSGMVGVGGRGGGGSGGGGGGGGGGLLENANPLIYERSVERPVTAGEEDEQVADSIDAREIFDLIRSINDPEHPLTLEELNVVEQVRVQMDVHITPGTHASEHAVNKQLADKERVAAALENTHLLEVVNQCLSARS